MPTYAELINEALVDLGALKPGASPSITIRDDCFTRLTQLWEGWGIDEAITNAQYHQAFGLTAGVSAYTLGQAGTLTTTAIPVRVYGAEAFSANFRAPVKVVSFQQFDETVQDPLGSSTVLAQILAADNAYPNINLRVFPVPAGTGSLFIDFIGSMAPLGVVGDTVALAPAFADALHFNLAMALLPQYGRQGVDGSAIAANAAASLGRIQSSNQKVLGHTAPQAVAQ